MIDVERQQLSLSEKKHIIKMKPCVMPQWINIGK